MRVVATAGHVDHGKSTLVRALTGIEPDRWAEERRRGMTIDLGYAWTTLPSGTELAFVDVPGHQRFIGNMLAGLGPAPAVLFVVAADEGWSRQSGEHLAAAAALDVRHGVLAVTRSDLADPGPALADAGERLRAAGIEPVGAVPVSGVTGAGIDDLRDALDRLVGVLPALDDTAPMRLWVDRVFSVRGSGTVVTGTLVAGRVTPGDEVELRGRRVSIRGVQALGRPRELVTAPARVALNLRGVGRDDVDRGDALTAPAAWYRTTEVDVRVTTAETLPEQLVLHVGSAALPVRLRPLGDGAHARIRLPAALPLRAGDRGVLRDPGRQTVAGGVLILDADPPPLTRRGAAARWAEALAGADGSVDVAAEVARRRFVRADHLRALGAGDEIPSGVRCLDEWLVAEAAWDEAVARVAPVLASWSDAHPLEAGMPVAVLRRELGLPDDRVATSVATAAGVPVAEGRLRSERRPDLGPAERAVAELERRLAADPFAAPEVHELADLRLGRRELAAAEAAGRLLRVTPEIVLLPSAPDDAVRRLATLDQPFTTSEARQALGTTRRVAVPLLEYLDANGRTERVDASRRRVR